MPEATDDLDPSGRVRGLSDPPTGSGPGLSATAAAVARCPPDLRTDRASFSRTLVGQGRCLRLRLLRRRNGRKSRALLSSGSCVGDLGIRLACTTGFHILPLPKNLSSFLVLEQLPVSRREGTSDRFEAGRFPLGQCCLVENGNVKAFPIGLAVRFGSRFGLERRALSKRVRGCPSDGVPFI